MQTISDERILVTGGAGFVGSHLTTQLLDNGNTVCVIDDFSTGKVRWIPDGVSVTHHDMCDQNLSESAENMPYDRIFHLASRSAVNDPVPESQFRQNVSMTQNAIDLAMESNAKEIIFTSTSTVYGEAATPTPENYGPLEPISMYGASKLASEAMLSAHAYNSDIKVRNFRFANVVGSRLRNAVIPDFIEKIQRSPERLEILGNGAQEKSYLHISDCIDAIVKIPTVVTDPFVSINLGTRTTTTVDQIASIVAESLDAEPQFVYSGGDRGWKGDVKEMQLAIDRATSLGWEPSFSSDQAVEQATAELVDELVTKGSVGNI